VILAQTKQGDSWAKQPGQLIAGIKKAAIRRPELSLGVTQDREGRFWLCTRVGRGPGASPNTVVIPDDVAAGLAPDGWIAAAGLPLVPLVAIFMDL